MIGSPRDARIIGQFRTHGRVDLLNRAGQQGKSCPRHSAGAFFATLVRCCPNGGQARQSQCWHQLGQSWTKALIRIEVDDLRIRQFTYRDKGRRQKNARVLRTSLSFYCNCERKRLITPCIRSSCDCRRSRSESLRAGRRFSPSRTAFPASAIARAAPARS